MQPLVRDNIRLAATVMLIRDTDRGMEVYMVQRPGRGDFPDLHVFPGGKVDEDDFAPDICFGIDDGEASRRLGIVAGGLRYWVAVARECFEECGVLLLQRAGVPLDLSEPSERGRFADYRAGVLDGTLSFSEMCRSEGLQVACDRLGYFSHWLTPSSAPRRFDTRFFLAALPRGQRTLADTDETADDQWERPSEALGRHGTGDWQMIDPTLRSLETLSGFSMVEEALTGVRAGNHLMPLTPQLRKQGMQPLSG